MMNMVSSLRSRSFSIFRRKRQTLKTSLWNNSWGIEDIATFTSSTNCPLKEVASVTSPKQRFVNMRVYPSHLVEFQASLALPKTQDVEKHSRHSCGRHGKTNAIILSVPYYFEHYMIRNGFYPYLLRQNPY